LDFSKGVEALRRRRVRRAPRVAHLCLSPAGARSHQAVRGLRRKGTHLPF